MRDCKMQGWLVRDEDEGKRFKVLMDGVIVYEGRDSLAVWQAFWAAAVTKGVRSVRYLVDDVEKSCLRTVE